MKEIGIESTRLTIKNLDITIQHQEGSDKVTLLTTSPETIKAFRKLEKEAPDMVTILEYPEDDAEGPVHMIVDQSKTHLDAEEAEDGTVNLILTPSSCDKKKRKGMSDLQEAYTCELCRELEKREGVQTIWVRPYEDKTIEVNGPAYVYVVID